MPPVAPLVSSAYPPKEYGLAPPTPQVIRSAFRTADVQTIQYFCPFARTGWSLKLKENQVCAPTFTVCVSLEDMFFPLG